MLRDLRRLIRPDDEVIADAERAALADEFAPLLDLRRRHGGLVERAEAKGLDPTTVLVLIQVFGPLVVKLIERWLARRG